MVVVTIPYGPRTHYPQERIYGPKSSLSAGNLPEENVSGEHSISLVEKLFFSHAGSIFMLGGSKKLITLDELPILPARLRALVNLSQIRYARRYIKLPLESLRQLDSGYELAYQLLRVNFPLVCTIQLLSVVTAAMYYAPIAFIQFFLEYIEADPQRKDTSWGRFYVTGIFAAHFVVILSNAQLLWLSNNNLRTNLSLQLNTLLYTKTMVRKDVPSNANTSSSDESGPSTDFSSKAKVMTLMTTDVGRARELSRLIFSLTDAAIGISIGTYMLYKLLGVSTFVGLGITFLMTPLNQLAGHSVVYLQKMIMSCRDERVALTNEFLGAIRMIKFMAWERSFEKRILAVRMRELKYQKKIFILQTLWDSLGNSIPLMFALGCFGHFTVIRGEDLTPSIAFTAVIFGQIKYNFNGLPEFFVAALQAFVSLRRIEKYLYVAEVRPHSKGQHQRVHDVAFQSATVGWPQIRTTVSESETPGNGFSLIGINTTFPRGELSLVCGKIGSGKTLLLLGRSSTLLGEADVLAGQVLCPRSVPDSYSSLSEVDDLVPWIMDGICAYVPQTPWLRNQSIKENILFGLPYDSERYEAVLEACALVHDLNVLEDGDECEVGEHGINLSGGQKARISLARAVYSRASILLLDDVLSAVDAHTAHHLWSHCFKSALMHHRTTILVSHHIQLCGPDSKLIVALDGGRVRFSGSWPKFQRSDVMSSILASNPAPKEDTENVEEITTVLLVEPASQGQPNKATIVNGKLPATKKDGEKAHKLPKEEKRFEGRISRDVWLLYIRANGNLWFWLVLWVALLVSSLSPVWEKGWLKIWSSSGDPPQKAGFFLGIYAGVKIATKIVRWLIIFSGSIHASKVLYEKLLETVLFANIQFHDTTSRGRVLNRFGKDFEAVDNELPNELGRALMIAMSVILTISTLTFVGGLPLFIASLLFLGIAFLSNVQITHLFLHLFGHEASVTSSPLFSIYGETISGLTVIRAFGMPTKFLKDMIICADTNMNPSYWVVGLNRWLNVRFQMITGALIGILALIILLNPSIDASWAGLALAFASTLTLDVYFIPSLQIRRWVDVEQTMVALERIKEYSDLPTEAPEYIEPRPPAAWPTSGSIQFENISVRYAAELPDVLHGLTFEVKPGEKVGLIGRTGSGKSTVGLALLRFVEAREGRILIDGVNIAKIGLTDLRSRLTIVPQDPVLLSGTLRSTLDIFGEYDDAGLYEALRRVNLLKPSGPDQSQSSIFANLDTPVSELGDNFSTGEKQLLCMARALLRRSKVLVMDEATASVDYATDEIISRTIREEFADSTIVTIAHRLRTVIDYDRIMVMDEGQIVEFDSPGLLINNEGSRFHKLCKAAGIEEFAKLNAMVH
ncbi:hypothetical protein M413DRAFT_63584 [Hebeloma cylindrosporum]|uniref:P-loop containing nucleoside triphosphate hydrolase protein n=1 Tax=Hebeloma cylindrosporum TaxID=76867 RepID=A0A0C2YA88_HEBCY|nr:hypothetical protein M413DRAFT_63584 [Hebeloma cylindrosporum h7]